MTTTAIANLRRVLYLDAATCVGAGLLMAAGAAGPLDDLLHLPGDLLRAAGLALLPIAAFIAFVGARATTSLPAVATVVAGNLAWVVASAWVIVGGTFAPNAAGVAFIAVQALAVLALSVLEIRGASALRTTSTRSPAHA